MDNIPHSNPDTIRHIKEWLTPILTGIIGLFIWTSVSEMRTDIKTLLAQQSTTTANIDNMKNDIVMLKATVYGQQKFDSKSKEISTFMQPAKKEDELIIK